MAKYFWLFDGLCESDSLQTAAFTLYREYITHELRDFFISCVGHEKLRLTVFTGRHQAVDFQQGYLSFSRSGKPMKRKFVQPTREIVLPNRFSYKSNLCLILYGQKKNELPIGENFYASSYHWGGYGEAGRCWKDMGQVDSSFTTLMMSCCDFAWVTFRQTGVGFEGFW